MDRVGNFNTYNALLFNKMKETYINFWWLGVKIMIKGKQILFLRIGEWG